MVLVLVNDHFDAMSSLAKTSDVKKKRNKRKLLILYTDTDSSTSFLHLCSDPAFVDRTVARGDVEAVEILEGVYRSLREEWPQNWADCVSWARRQWETLYSNHIRQLLHCFPPEQVTQRTVYTPVMQPRGNCHCNRVHVMKACLDHIPKSKGFFFYNFIFSNYNFMTKKGAINYYL